MAIVFSGMRPTGRLHIGHLVGALEKWLELQKEHDAYFSIVDWHALTTSYDNTSGLLDNIYQMAADWLSVGIDFEKNSVFVQSEVEEHAALHLMLSMIVPMPWLERNPTLKAMINDMHIQHLHYGLMGYPVLQAADILLYKGELVPVGEDQIPHLEMSREIVRSFNHYYGSIFPEPQAVLTKSPKLLGTDGRKMSKSLDNCIYLSDSPETIRKKTSMMITDPQKVRKNDPGRPEICSVFSYHKVFNPSECDQIAHDCRHGLLGCVENKKRLASRLIEMLEPVRERRAAFEGKSDTIRQLLEDGRNKAKKAASKTMDEVYKSAGMRR